MYTSPTHCPTCSGKLVINELGCLTCGTVIRGEWEGSPFERLTGDQQAFLVLFVRSRGNLSEVERALGVSYPTVRAKLEEVIQSLGQDAEASAAAGDSEQQRRRDVLERVKRGEMSATDAVNELRRLQAED